jgi:hypothetical protein
MRGCGLNSSEEEVMSVCEACVTPEFYYYDCIRQSSKISKGRNHSFAVSEFLRTYKMSDSFYSLKLHA